MAALSGYAANPAGSGRGYALNPFGAGAAGGKQMMYANALRSYSPHAFSNAAPSGVGAMAPHLSQAVPLDPDIIAAYKDFQTNPQAVQYGQSGADLEKLWKLSPNSPVFQPGYQHNPYITQRSGELRQTRLTNEYETGLRNKGYTTRTAEDGSVAWFTPEGYIFNPYTDPNSPNYVPYQESGNVVNN